MHATLRTTLATAIGTVTPLALAHSPYLLPNRFDVTQRDHVSVQASFTEDFFVPDVVMKASAWHVVGPDGADTPLTPVYTQDVAVLDVATTQRGTYRISTGIREGRLSKATIEGDQWQFLDEREPLPRTTRVYDIRSITHAEVYVTAGSPNDAALAPYGRGLEFEMLTHPNSLFAGDAARLRVLFDGKPIANEHLALQRAREGVTSPPPLVELTTAADGSVTLPLPEPGLYHAMLRYRFALPGAAAKAESHTYALTLEVTD